MAKHALPEDRIREIVEVGAGSRDALPPDPEPRDVAMAFQAHREHGGAVERARIRAPVRVMAALAALHTNGRVLEHERSALVGMASRARLVVAEGLGDHARGMRRAPRSDRCAVRVMAVGAFHRTFVDAMLERHLKPRANLEVAAVAKRRLRVGQQRAELVRVVNRVATGAADLGRQVGGPADMHLAEVPGVTAHAAILSLGGRKRGKADDPLDVAGGGMGETRPVAALAASLARGFLAGDGRAVVRVDPEVRRHLGMACLADPVANELPRGDRLALRGHGCAKRS